MLVNMKTIISQVMEFCTVAMEQLLMKDYGKMVCLMEKDFLMIFMAKRRRAFLSMELTLIF